MILTLRNAVMLILVQWWFHFIWSIASGELLIYNLLVLSFQTNDIVSNVMISLNVAPEIAHLEHKEPIFQFYL